MRPRATDRDAVLQATAQRIAIAGIQHTTVDDVASEAGVSRATVYRHAGGKHELVEGALRREVATVVEKSAEAACTQMTPEAAVRAASTVGMRSILSSPVLNRIVSVDLQANLQLLTVQLPAWTAIAFRDLLQCSNASSVPLMQALEPIAEDLARFIVQMFHTPTLDGDNLNPEAVGERAAKIFGPAVSESLKVILAGGRVTSGSLGV